jgi:hypothetical protein
VTPDLSQMFVREESLGGVRCLDSRLHGNDN